MNISIMLVVFIASLILILTNIMLMVLIINLILILFNIMDMVFISSLILTSRAMTTLATWVTVLAVDTVSFARRDRLSYPLYHVSLSYKTI